MNGIRPFVAADITEVVNVHRLAFGHKAPTSPALADEYRRWLSSVFLESPMCRANASSLVYEYDGTVVAFLGVIPRQVRFRGITYQANSSSNFCVHPERRGIVGLKMLKEYLVRSPDLAFVDEIQEQPRELHERLGFVVSPAQSVRWVMPLRPARRSLSLLEGRVPKPATMLAVPIAKAIDGILRNVRRSPFRYEASALVASPLSSDGLAALLSEFGSENDVRPITSDGSTVWLVERARSMEQHGELNMTAFRTARGSVVGWSVLYLLRGGQCEVLQMVAQRTAAADVLTEVARIASACGAISLAGTLHPDFLTPLAARRAVFDGGAPTRLMCVRSRHPGLLEAFWRGNLLLSRLDGEWCQHLR